MKISAETIWQKTVILYISEKAVWQKAVILPVPEKNVRQKAVILAVFEKSVWQKAVILAVFEKSVWQKAVNSYLRWQKTGKSRKFCTANVQHVYGNLPAFQGFVTPPFSYHQD